MSTTTEIKKTNREINTLADKHHRIIELMAERLGAQATTRDILRRAEDAASAELAKSAYSLAACAAATARAENELELLTRDLINDTDEERSIVTPFGVLKLTKTSTLVSPDDGGDQAVIAMLHNWSLGELTKKATDVLEDCPVLDITGQFIRTEEKLNREALEQLPEAALNVLKLRRVRATSFTIKEKKLTLENAQALLAKARENVSEKATS